MTDFVKQKQEVIAQASYQQRLASNPKTSVWVEASAGTGKTKVLSDRVLRLLLDGVLPSRILCLTYTKAAAVEMNNRIAEKLSKWAVADNEKLVKELENLLGKKVVENDEIMSKSRRLFALLLDTPGGVKIQTIHSFCQEVLKRFPLEAKISPYFEVMDDRSSREALDDIKQDMLNNSTDDKIVKALNYLTSNSNERDFPSIMESITEQRNLIEDCLSKYASADELIDKTATSFGFEKDISVEKVEAEFWNNLDVEKLGIVIKALDAGTANTAEKAFVLAKARNEKNLDEFLNTFLTEGKPRARILVNASKARFPEAEKFCNDFIALSMDISEKIKTVNLFLSTKSILVLANEMLEKYHAYKKLHSKLDYNDLIVICKKLFESPKVAEWILYKLDGGIDNVLIDEAQDTSPEQWAIVKAITNEFFSGKGNHEKEPTVFVVGDRKQSIYSFQGADPAEFEKMHKYFEKESNNFKTVNMEVSFRSTAAILDTVNKVFDSEKAKKGVVDETQNIKHTPSRIGDGGKVEVWELVEPEKDDTSAKVWRPPVEKIDIVSPSTKLANKIAEMIKQKVSKGELLESKGRPLKYGDFLILVQRRSAFVEEMVRACKNIGVKIAGVDKIKLNDQIVVNDLLALAKFVLLPSDDLNLACLLKSPLFALEDGDLYNLCYDRKDDSVWNRLKNDKRYEKEANLLEKIITVAKEVRPFELFSYVLNNLEGRKKFVSRLGKDCEDAIDVFVNLSLNFEMEHIPSLQLFVEWMEADDVEVKRDLEQGDNDEVRLMTVHGSKGLQAPVVILPDTTRVKTLSREAKLFKQDELLFYPLNKECYNENCEKLISRQKELSLEEYHRLLYVALTRAEERLCICGFKGKSKVNGESWYEVVKEAFADIAVEVKKEGLVYEVKQFIEPENKKKTKFDKADVVVPLWLKENPKDEGCLAKPLTPSHQDESLIAAISPLAENNNEKLYTRGKLIHKILQFLPSVEEQKRESLIESFLEKQASNFEEDEKNKIKTEVMNLLNNPSFAPLFSQNSVAEVALMGVVGENIISGQIDRLVVCEDKVMIVDYKTNRPAAEKPEDVPKAYIKQMKSYKQLVEEIYPDKKTEAFILWTNTAQIMKIDNI